jgi:hypothetical protein
MDGFNLSTDSNSQQGALGDGEQLAFQLHFTDASARLFTADLTPVPEPSVSTLLPLGFLAVTALESRRQRRGAGSR